MQPNKMPLNYCSLGFSDDENVKYQDAEQAIDKADKWDWLKTFDPGSKGFLWCDARELDMIGHHMRHRGHTAATFAKTMTEMQRLAQMGIDEYCSSYTQAIAAPAAPKQGPVRSEEMDKKVLEEYQNRPPFARAPKWSAEYIKAFPAVLASLAAVQCECKRNAAMMAVGRNLTGPGRDWDKNPCSCKKAV